LHILQGGSGNVHFLLSDEGIELKGGIFAADLQHLCGEQFLRRDEYRAVAGDQRLARQPVAIFDLLLR
jgi:hypothetical protein